VSDVSEFINIEIPEKDGLSRRDFMHAVGASFAALSMSGCGFRAPKEKIIPYVELPEGIVPGRANWYASTCGGCLARCGALVKSLDGRPIKMEGNPEHPLSAGGLCARGQGTVLDLYDSARLRGPMKGDAATTWKETDEAILQQLEAIKAKGGRIRLLSSTVSSPTLRDAIESFVETWPNTRHVQYDPVSYSAILEAHQVTNGQRILPWYRFDRARVIVSFDADFLGTWISPVEFAHDWSKNRKLAEDGTGMSRHVQFEARMSITGANADERFPLAPSKLEAAILELGRKIAARLKFEIGERVLASGTFSGLDESKLESLATDLTENAGRSLVVCGSHNVRAQLAVNFINHMLLNYGETLDIERPSLQSQGSDEDSWQLLGEMKRGEVDALFLLDTNPAYHHPAGEEFAEAMKGIGLTVSLAQRSDETAQHVKLLCPDHHSLESWKDSRPHFGVYSLFQPLIAPLYKTRSALESFLTWTGNAQNAYDALKQFWQKNIHTRIPDAGSFQSFWDAALHDGVALVDSERIESSPFNIQALPKEQTGDSDGEGKGDFELVTFASVGIGDGAQANNPWLQELPDPVTKMTWGNAASMSPGTAKKLKTKDGRVVEISAGPHNVRLPVQIQRGMPEGVVAAALGYGRTNAGEVAANFPMEKMFSLEKELLGGANLYPFIGTPKVNVKKTRKKSPLAKSQTFDYQTEPITGHERQILREISLAEHKENGHDDHGAHEDVSLWPEHEYEGHKWAMVIDLNACTGCSACAIACQAENNIPVVGKAEVRKSRDMHWMRLDRYYSGSPDEPDEQPEVGFMPMLCQHCDNAPCETVCPVLATLHSSEGLNMQVYNRCVGTRYCANNCPYKVRRFNWFDYSHNDLVQNLVLNPDVTVRTRGVIEKCSSCVQRIAEVKERAKGENRKLADGEIQPACMQSCPSQAIAFGDINDPKSRVSKLSKDKRAYGAVAEVGTKPSVKYLTKVRNKA
jgi:molybdopterin-containing oxidoreductase family iron-sulfur binding subunit